MYDSNTLYHYGVMGMKWGVRRSRNRYGVVTKAGLSRSRKIQEEYSQLANVTTLTAKGKARKAELASAYKQITGKSIISKPSNRPKQQSTNDDNDNEIDVKSMTNEQLQAHNYRKQLENTYLSQFKMDKPSTVDYRTVANKRMSDMTNDELQAYNFRKQLETTYISALPKPEISKGKKLVDGVMGKVIAPAAASAGKKFLEKKLTDMLDQKFGTSNAKETVEGVAKGFTKEVKSAAKTVSDDINKSAKKAEAKADKKQAKKTTKDQDIPTWYGTVEPTERDRRRYTSAKYLVPMK